MSATTTIVGIKFSDQLAALLDHAQAHGFRVEPAKGTKPNAVVVYAPDKDIAPINVSERAAKFNKAHYENVKRQLYRAGLEPLPADQPDRIVAGTDRDEVAAASPEGSAIINLTNGFTASSPSGEVIELDLTGEAGPKLAHHLINGLAVQMGLGKAEQMLASDLVETVLSWAITFAPARIEASAEGLRAEIEAEYRGEIKAALELAAENEARALRAEKATEKADAAAKKAREDCGAALARAKEAEANAARLEAAIAPLRAVLGGQS